MTNTPRTDDLFLVLEGDLFDVNELECTCYEKETCRHCSKYSQSIKKARTVVAELETELIEAQRQIEELKDALSGIVDAYANEIGAISNGDKENEMELFAKGAGLRIICRELLDKK